ncbi:bifunctional hydroxymethylpyrimidine kinase/phosphomethylpyrimidine kinase [Enterococcus sp.]|uniref:bifunctional hydroxymethylpyrimidine kinase/phosphomethylpyrimidine kinase n=1 Tax=Enterococcus sp. TaxID=35783 RepID=UPI002FC8E60B
MKKVLTIAGSDSTGGAGIQADLKTFEEFGVFGFSSVTSVVTMDPTNGWTHEVTVLPEELLRKQLVSVFAGEAIHAIKTGMIGNERNIQVASEVIKEQSVKNIVVDPVIACKGTAQILQPESVEGLKRYLLPQARVVTPNLVEAGILSGLGDLKTIDDMKEAAKVIHQLGVANVVVKGGHRLQETRAVDLCYNGSDFEIFEGPRYATEYNHGAGCTFAAAITAALAKGYTVLEAVRVAKLFVAAAIQQGVRINPYVGHVWHGAYNSAQERMEEVL